MFKVWRITNKFFIVINNKAQTHSGFKRHVYPSCDTPHMIHAYSFECRFIGMRVVIYKDTYTPKCEGSA